MRQLVKIQVNEVPVSGPGRNFQVVSVLNGGPCFAIFRVNRIFLRLSLLDSLACWALQEYGKDKILASIDWSAVASYSFDRKIPPNSWPIDPRVDVGSNE